MSTNQSIYQQPPSAYTKNPQNKVKPSIIPNNVSPGFVKNPQNKVKPSIIPNNVSPGFVKTRQFGKGNIYKSPITNINYGEGSYSPDTSGQTYINPAYIGTSRPSAAPLKTKPNLEEEKIQGLEKIEEMKSKAEIKSADEMSNSATRKYAIIFAAVVLVITGVVLLWEFYISKSRSGKDVLTSSDAGANVANSSGKWAESSGKSADSSKS